MDVDGLRRLVHDPGGIAAMPTAAAPSISIAISPMRFAPSMLWVGLPAMGSVLSLFLSACAAGPPGATSAEQGYLCQDSTSASFLDLTQSNGGLSGTLDEVYIDPNDETQTKSIHDTLSGTVNGSKVSFDVGGLTTIQGHYQGDRIVLAVPQEDGSLSTLTCNPSDSDHYNSAAAKVRQLAAHNAESRAQAQAEAQARHDIDTAAGSLNGAYQAVQQDTSTLSKSSALGEGSRDIQQAQADLGVAQRDLQKTQAAAGTIDCGPDAGTVAADAGSVKADRGSVQADQGSLQADINSAENDIQALDNAEQKFQQAESETSDYSVAAPAQSDISSAENAVRNQEAQDKSAMGGYVSQVADLGRQADNLAAAAQQVCGR